MQMIRDSYIKEYKAFRSATTMNNQCLHLIVFRILPSHRPVKLCNQNNITNTRRPRKQFANKHFTRAFDAINKCNGKSMYNYIEVLPTSTCTPREILTYLQHSAKIVNGSLNSDSVDINSEQSKKNYNIRNYRSSVKANLANEQQYLLVFPLNLSVLKRRIKLVTSALTRHRLYCDYFVKQLMHAK